MQPFYIICFAWNYGCKKFQFVSTYSYKNVVCYFCLLANTSYGSLTVTIVLFAWSKIIYITTTKLLCCPYNYCLLFFCCIGGKIYLMYLEVWTYIKSFLWSGFNIVAHGAYLQHIIFLSHLFYFVPYAYTYAMKEFSRRVKRRTSLCPYVYFLLSRTKLY